ncbi:hypothetical protein IFR04_010064 [Cadophora malorum]|uniref:Uncharacterized protein n=1 Tax=Cadophora malorum TaxID=108018 RepID=A0A8H7T851_9HELO|nr:hypothetical protein IFR04_010064 [Cadophora malorum]
MSEPTFPRLRSARHKIIPDRPGSPPRYHIPTTTTELSFFVSPSDPSWSSHTPFRICPPASRILDLCKSGDIAQAEIQVEELPDWVREDFRRQGLENALEDGDLDAARFFLKHGAKLDVSGGSIVRPALVCRRFYG